MTKTHTFLMEKLQSEFPTATTDKELLQCIFRNYRAGKGMSLTFEAFKVLDDSKVYTFHQVPHPGHLDSRISSLLDTVSSEPYYIGRNFIYICDETLVFSHMMAPEYADFCEFLKENWKCLKHPK